VAPTARVTAPDAAGLLELPEAAQQMVGEGRIALSAVEHLLSIGRVCAPLLDSGDRVPGRRKRVGCPNRLAREPGWVLDSALRSTDRRCSPNTSAASSGYELGQLKLGKKAQAQVERVQELSKVLDRYSYGTEVRFFVYALLGGTPLARVRRGRPSRQPTRTQPAGWKSSPTNRRQTMPNTRTRRVLSDEDREQRRTEQRDLVRTSVGAAAVKRRGGARLPVGHAVGFAPTRRATSS